MLVELSSVVRNPAYPMVLHSVPRCQKRFAINMIDLLTLIFIFPLWRGGEAAGFIVCGLLLPYSMDQSKKENPEHDQKKGLDELLAFFDGQNTP